MELEQEFWNYYQQYGMPPSADMVEEQCRFTREDQRCCLNDCHDGDHVFQ